MVRRRRDVDDRLMATDGALADNNQVAPARRVRRRAGLRTLPSGDELVSFRITVARPPGERVRVDNIDCASTRSPVRRAAIRCHAGDMVELTGSLRRRFWRSPAGSPASRYEVEVITLSRERSPRAGDAGQSGSSAKRRISRPDAGFGVNRVDLRGIRAPAAATAATAATGVGRSSTAVPPAGLRGSDRVRLAVGVVDRGLVVGRVPTPVRRARGAAR